MWPHQSGVLSAHDWVIKSSMCAGMHVHSPLHLPSLLLPPGITHIAQVAPLCSSQVPSISYVQNDCWNLRHATCQNTPALQATETKRWPHFSLSYISTKRLYSWVHVHVCLCACMCGRYLRCVLPRFFRMIKTWSMNLSVQMVWMHWYL